MCLLYQYSDGVVSRKEKQLWQVEKWDFGDRFFPTLCEVKWGKKGRSENETSLSFKLFHSFQVFSNPKPQEPGKLQLIRTQSTLGFNKMMLLIWLEHGKKNWRYLKRTFGIVLQVCYWQVMPCLSTKLKKKHIKRFRLHPFLGIWSPQS